MTIAADLGTTTSLPRRVLGGIAASVRNVAAKRRERHEYRRLLQADDGILKDVGLARWEVEQALRGR